MQYRTFTLQYIEGLENELSADEQGLCTAAREAPSLAYAPYSNFFVGAAALLEDATLVKAANLENAAYPQCICAEAGLLASIHSQFPGKQIVAVAIAVDSLAADPAGAAPCGSCRQQLFEAENRQKPRPIRLFLLGELGAFRKFESVAHLLPLGFSF